jgi:hypothetical protein
MDSPQIALKEVSFSLNKLAESRSHLDMKLNHGKHKTQGFSDVPREDPLINKSSSKIMDHI